MIQLPSAVRIFLCTRPTDLRKSFDGLTGLVQECFAQDLLTGHLFPFLNRRRIGSRSSTSIATGWPSGTNASRPAPFNCLRPAQPMASNSSRHNWPCSSRNDLHTARHAAIPAVG